jgi:hypothetical protein
MNWQLDRIDYKPHIRAQRSRGCAHDGPEIVGAHARLLVYVEERVIGGMAVYDRRHRDPLGRNAQREADRGWVVGRRDRQREQAISTARELGRIARFLHQRAAQQTSLRGAILNTDPRLEESKLHAE